MKKSTGWHATRTELLLAITLLAFTSSARGQALAPTPFLPLSLAEMPATDPAVAGDVTVKGQDLSLSQDTGDTFDTFDSHLNGAFLLHFEAERKRVGLLL